MFRSYPSGANKRKLKEEKEQKLKRMKGSLTKFIVKADSEIQKADEHPKESSTNSKKLVEINNVSTTCANNLSKDLVDSEIPKSNQQIDFKESDNNIQSSIKTQESNMPSTSLEIQGEADEDLQIYVNDIALVDKVTDRIREYFLQNPPSQNMQFASQAECIIGGNKKRYLTETHFYRIKCNGEKVQRDWLTLSPTLLSLFCWICKLFSKNKTTLSATGFSDWKHATERLREHENCYHHREAVCIMIQRKEICCRINKTVVEKEHCESKYWFEVLRRVVAVAKFLVTRGLPFFGRDETIGSLSNGNFLGCLEMMSEFDPFLAKHLETYGNPGSGKTSYLSSTTLNEFVDLMAVKVTNFIIQEIKNAKFYSIIVDSTPDLSHTDQLTFVARYVSPDCQAIERFLTFIPISGHSSQYLEETVLNYIERVGLDITDCRGQSYDNASNMAGKYNGLQARIKLLNPLAEFVPCAAHSLNLVVVKAVECNGRVLDFFTFLQEIYNFFSHSTHRWKVLSEKMKEKGAFLTLKSRSATRWCANAAATKALKQNYKEIVQVLANMKLNEDESLSTRSEASALHKKMLKLETAICATMWDSILQQTDCVNKNLQNPSLNLSHVPEFFTSLINFVNTIRDKYERYEEQAFDLVGHKNYSAKRLKKTPKNFYDGQCAETVLDSRETFRTSCFYVVCDNMIAQLKSRMSAYQGILQKFICLFGEDKESIYKNAKVLQSAYSYDLEETFVDELIHIQPIIEKEFSLSNQLNKIHKIGIKDTFANVETALRLFLTLPISNCSGERSFSLLKRIKSPLRTLITDSKLSSLAILSMEGDITVKLDYEDLITDFTSKKRRRKYIKNH